MNKKGIIFGGIIIVLVVVAGQYFLIGQKKETVSGPAVVEVKNYAQSIDSLDDPFLGDKDSKIVIVEFADFECPYCQQEFSIIREVSNLYPQIKIIFRDLPLVDIHKNALPAAIAASCANKQEKFWQFHDQLYINQGSLSSSTYQQIARSVGLNMDKFSSCITDSSIKDEVIKDAVDANNMGVQGTPTFFINGKKIAGVVTLDMWKNIINMALATVK